jgi:hypothetical protein
MAFAEDTALDLVFDLVESLAWADPVGLVPACYRYVGDQLEPVLAPLPGAVGAPDRESSSRPRFVS